MGLMRESFIFYRSFYESIKELPADLQVEIIHAISEFALYGKKTDMSPVCKALFTAFVPSINTAKNRYDACVENGKKGAEYGKKGGRPKTPKKTPNDCESETPNETPKTAKSGESQTPNETGCKPLTDTVTVSVTDTVTVDKVSKKVSNEKEINSLTPARAYARESYDEILSRLGFSDDLKPQVFKFIQFQQANGKKVTNAMLERTMAGIKGAAENRVRDSLSGGFMDKLNADLTPYRDDIEQYIHASIQQALDGGWFELKAPKDFKTAAEWEREAKKDMGLLKNKEEE